MDQSGDQDRRTRGRRLKLTRVIDEYDLRGMGAELERRWTADSDERTSLRDLADDLNVEILTTVLYSDGEQPLDGEVENAYRLLTDEEVSDGDRTRMRRRLERQGIDVDDLLEDFVTYQAVRTYLMQERNAEYEYEHATPEEDAQSVRQLVGRVSTVTENKLEQLSDRDDITLGEFRTLVDVTVICEDCGEQVGAAELIERGACACTQEVDQWTSRRRRSTQTVQKCPGPGAGDVVHTSDVFESAHARRSHSVRPRGHVTSP